MSGPPREPTALFLGRAVVGVASVVATVASTHAGVATLPFEMVKPGMKGSGRTVFSGSTVETFQVEILGTLPKIGPDQDLILARLSGGPLDEAGVLAGMSGSPVTVDGKLVGAVAYTWGFAKEPIAGITPIGEMLAVAALGDGERPPARATVPAGFDTRPLRSAASLHAFITGLGESLFPQRWLAASVPLSVAGIDPQALARAAPDLVRAGFLPQHAGAPTDEGGPQPALVPGSAMGLKLVRGDVDMTATGTVTWVDGDRVLAFGHPLFGLGSVDLPLTGARVEAVLPSLQQSVRICRPLGEVGAVLQDRASGVAGRIGARPRMIPVRLQLSGPDGTEHAFSFDVADDPLLSPLLLYVSLNGVLASKERAFGNATIRLRSGSVVKMLDGEDVELDNLYAGPLAFDFGTGIAAYVLHLLMNNTWTEPRIAGVNLLLEYEAEPRLARIRHAALDRYRVTPGETVEVTVRLAPYRGPDLVLRREIVVPPETPPGRLTVAIGGAEAVSRADELEEPVLPRDLDQLVWLINQLRRNDRIYILATRDDSGVLLGGDRLPNLPPSVARMLVRPGAKGSVTYIPERSILEEVLPTDYAVDGDTRIELEVEAP